MFHDQNHLCFHSIDFKHRLSHNTCVQCPSIQLKWTKIYLDPFIEESSWAAIKFVHLTHLRISTGAPEVSTGFKWENYQILICEHLMIHYSDWCRVMYGTRYLQSSVYNISWKSRRSVKDVFDVGFSGILMIRYDNLRQLCIFVNKDILPLLYSW